MAGILDKKSRILDFVITQNGRSQIENGDIRYKYATLSDKSIIYTRNHDSSNAKKFDVSNSEKEYFPFEISHKGNDEINPEFDLRKYFLGTKVNPNDGKEIENGFNFDDSVNTYINDFTLSSYLKNLKFLKTKNLLNDDKKISFFNEGTINKNFDFNDEVLKYSTIKSIDTNKKSLPVIALDKRFSHKKNFKVMIPKDISGNDLYEKSNFKNIDELEDNNAVGFLFPTYKLKSSKDFENREEEIIYLLKDLEKNKEIHKKEFILLNPSDFDSFVFEMHEVHETKNENNEVIKAEIEKMHFVKIGEFYDKQNVSTKKVYLIGKFFNTREDTKDLDVLFNFNNGQVNLENKSNFSLSAFFSFVCLFTLVIE